MSLKTIESRRGIWELHPARWGGLVTLVLTCAIGCGPIEQTGATDEPKDEPKKVGSTAQKVIVGNGLSLNGLSLNGLSLNGLSLNGLNLAGLSTASFKNWFQADPTLRNEVMNYVVGCAVPSGETRSYTDSNTHITYEWTGVLGLAQSWASGVKATKEELQVVSACMAAHASKSGIHVTISVLGLNGAGSPIPYTSQELTDYSVQEACFFGNLFDESTGVFGGNDGLSLSSSQSSPRVCGLPDSSGSSQCPPMKYVGSCSTYCTRDATNTFYTSCTYGSVTYRPVTTRMKPADIYSCGDGVCQRTESCGTGTTPDNCADCRTCS